MQNARNRAYDLATSCSRVLLISGPDGQSDIQRARSHQTKTPYHILYALDEEKYIFPNSEHWTSAVTQIAPIVHRHVIHFTLERVV